MCVLRSIIFAKADIIMESAKILRRGNKNFGRGVNRAQTRCALPPKIRPCLSGEEYISLISYSMLDVGHLFKFLSLAP